MPTTPSRRPFLLWLGLFYAGWTTLVILGDHWNTVISHWPISLAMAFGSYVAGSTPMGGGTVGFPVLVLLFDHPGALGRNFGLAVQSVGMVSASIYILSARREIDWHLLRPALAGSLVGTPLGAALVAPFVPDLWVKLIFAIVWASFGLMHLVKMRELISTHGRRPSLPRLDIPVGLTVGIVGGIVASITGVGIDMILYATMVLLYRSDLRISIPSSVILMAFTSLVGVTSNVVLSRLNPDLYGMDPEVFANWIAAAPVVALGAPLGALIVNLISRTPTLVIVSILCLVQFVWTITHEGVVGWHLVAAIGCVLAMNGLFHLLYEAGGRRMREEGAISRKII